VTAVLVLVGLLTVATAVAPLLARPGTVLEAWPNAVAPLAALTAATVTFAVLGNGQVVDRLIYTREFRVIGGADLVDAFSARLGTGGEPLYIAFLWLVSRAGTDSTAGLYTAVAIVSVAAFVAGTRLLVSWSRVPFVLFAALAIGFFTAYAGLIVRQGLSLAALFVGVCLVLRGCRWWTWASAFAVASLFHWSAVFVVVLISLVVVTRLSLRAAVVVWAGAAALFVTGLQRTLFEPLAVLVPAVDGYTGSAVTHQYGGSNRLDFLAFSAVFLVAGLVLRKLVAVPAWYDTLLVVYAAANTYFLAFGFIAYADRLAAYSWYLAPLIVAVPLLGLRGRLGPLVVVLATALLVVAGLVRGPFAPLVGLAGW
jgi:ABC-type multidrug transport system fused ATPase/permease subunit